MVSKTRTKDHDLIEVDTVAVGDDNVGSGTDEDLTAYNTGEGITIQTNLGRVNQVVVSVLSVDGYELKADTVTTSDGTIQLDIVDNTGADLTGDNDLTATTLEFAYSAIRT